MDRLVCGDVGFGKTEVALRAAFVVAMSGRAGRRRRADDAAGAPALPHLLGALRRLAGEDRASCRASRRRRTPKRRRRELAAGDVDIVIGTHALLAEVDRVPQSRPSRSSTRSSISAWRTRSG